jgi:hypothetical protein
MKSNWLAILFALASLFTTSCQTQSMNDLPEHAVIVHFNYGSTDLQPLFALEEKLEQASSLAGAGEFDGNEVAADGSDGYLYMYGPNADRLFEVIKPVLESCVFMKGAKVRKRYGPPKDGVRESIVTIAP